MGMQTSASNFSIPLIRMKVQARNEATQMNQTQQKKSSKKESITLMNNSNNNPAVNNYEAFMPFYAAENQHHGSQASNSALKEMKKRSVKRR